MATPKFRVGDRVRIDMTGLDSSFRAAEGEGLTQVLDTRDRGTGIVVRVAPPEEREPEEEGMQLYQVAVVEGRFDGHRNALGELHVWETELQPQREG